jgi:predicted DNA-binding helix-hairpin-helix protein
MRIEDKLTILADAAKYDVSCASSGSRRKNSGARLGNAATSGICHNIELPSETSLKRLTRAKTYASVLTPMGVIQETIAETREDRKRLRHVPAFAPGGQSTQLIVGASPESDFDILNLADRLYHQQSLKRVDDSAYVPVDQAPTGPKIDRLPDLVEPPLRRENRLYQADWLMRLYGFSMDEVISSAPLLAIPDREAHLSRL